LGVERTGVVLCVAHPVAVGGGIEQGRGTSRLDPGDVAERIEGVAGGGGVQIHVRIRDDQQVTGRGRVLGGDRGGLGQQALASLLGVALPGELGELRRQLRVRGQQRGVRAAAALPMERDRARRDRGGGVGAQRGGGHDRRAGPGRAHLLQGLRTGLLGGASQLYGTRDDAALLPGGLLLFLGRAG